MTLRALRAGCATIWTCPTMYINRDSLINISLASRPEGLGLLIETCRPFPSISHRFKPKVATLTKTLILKWQIIPSPEPQSYQKNVSLNSSCVITDVSVLPFVHNHPVWEFVDVSRKWKEARHCDKCHLTKSHGYKEPIPRVNSSYYTHY